MNKNKIAEAYATATKSQSLAVDNLNQALQVLNTDNYLFSLCEPIELAYTELVEQLLGPELFDWLGWWMYEADYGTKSTMYSINNQDYDPKLQTFEQFWTTINA
jgi:hypothetical protein